MHFSNPFYLVSIFVVQQKNKKWCATIYILSLFHWRWGPGSNCPLGVVENTRNTRKYMFWIHFHFMKCEQMYSKKGMNRTSSVFDQEENPVFFLKKLRRENHVSQDVSLTETNRLIVAKYRDDNKSLGGRTSTLRTPCGACNVHSRKGIAPAEQGISHLRRVQRFAAACR